MRSIKSPSLNEISSKSWAVYSYKALHFGNAGGFGFKGGLGLPPPGAGFPSDSFKLARFTLKV